MFKEIIKRDGLNVPYELEKIQAAVFKAAYNGKVYGDYIGSYHINPVKANFLANNVAKRVNDEIMASNLDKFEIDEIQNIVVKHLNELSKFVGQAYLSYKTQKQIERGF